MRHDPCSYDIGAAVDQALQRSGVDVEVFRGKRVFVTGGTGFFGVWLLAVLSLVQDRLGGALEIVALSRNPEGFTQKYRQFNFDRRIRFVRGDIRTFRADLRRVTHLVHMATTNASETFGGEDQLAKLDLLYTGTRNVLEQCSTSLESVLFTSSGVAYGGAQADRISERDQEPLDTLAAGAALGIGKLAAEYLVAYFAQQKGYHFAIARCFAFAGEYLPQDLHYAFGNFIRNAMKCDPIVVRGDGEDRRSYLYIGDAMAWLLRMLAQPKDSVHNVGSELPISMRELAQKVAQAVHTPVEVSVLGVPDDTGNFKRSSYIPSTHRVRSDYPGLAQWTSIDEIIHKMLSPLPGPPAS
jgi:nucleoside-diphosphate-sugar epimerase